MTDAEPQFLTVGEGADERRIAYLESPGAPHMVPGLLWLPGLKSDMISTKASYLAEWALKTGRPFLRFDYSGHGQSDGEFEECTMGRWLEDALAVLERQATGPQVLIGSSMGGWIALMILQKLRDQGRKISNHVCGAVLIAPAWNMTQDLMWERFDEKARKTIEEEGVYRWPSEYDDQPYAITKALIEEGRKHLLDPTGLDPGCPVRIIQGQRDADVPWQHGLALVDLLTSDDVTLTLVKDAGHRLSRPQDLELIIREAEVLWEQARKGAV